MKMVMIALLFIGGPMALTQLLYRLIDHRGKKTKLLTDRFPILKEKKFLLQIVVPLLIVVLFGGISLVCSIPVHIFFIVCGVLIGFVNGMAVTIMYQV